MSMGVGVGGRMKFIGEWVDKFINHLKVYECISL